MAAQRELLEETGYTTDIKNFKVIGSGYSAPGKLVVMVSDLIFVSIFSFKNVFCEMYKCTKSERTTIGTI